MSIRAKVIFLVAAISLAAFIGFGVFIYNASTMRDMSHNLTREHVKIMAEGEFNFCNDKVLIFCYPLFNGG